MKRVLKLLISLLVHTGDILKGQVRRVFSRPQPGRCVVLYYHGIRPELRTHFAKQMDVLARLTTVLPGNHSGELLAGRHYSMITFDDGFVSYRDQALPEMASRGLASTVFVPTGSLGGPPRWIRRANHPALSETVMTEAQLAALAQNPLVTVGSHSITHPDFLTLDSAASTREFVDSRLQLESIVGRPITLFSFPHGRYNEFHLRQAGEAGYSRTFGIQPRPAIREISKPQMGRVATEPDDWPLEFRLKLLGAYRWMASGK